VELDSTDQYNWYYLSLSYNAAEKYQEAIVCGLKALVLEPTYVDLELNLADAYSKAGDIKSAEAHFNQALVLSPDNPTIYSNMAVAYVLANNLILAENCYLRALELDPANTSRYIAVGDFFRDDKKDFGKSEYYFKKATELEADNYQIYEGLGYLYLRMQNTKKAEEAFNKAIELAPEVAWNYYNLACLYSLSGNTKKALIWLEKAFDKGMQDVGHLKIDHDLDPLREEAGFKALMKKYFNVE
jgi:Flp pilus assembly protein TadD